MKLAFKPVGLKLLAALTLCGLSAASIAQAKYPFPPQGAPGAIMTFRSGPLQVGTPSSAAALIEAVHAAVNVSTPAQGYGSAVITNSASVQNQALIPNGSAQNIAELSTFAFGLAQTTTMQFRAGLDTGMASSLVVDGRPLTFVTANQWWDGNWNDSVGVSTTQAVTLPAGNHVFQVYGLEPCCSGAQSFQYMTAGGQWTNFSAVDSKLAVRPAQ